LFYWLLKWVFLGPVLKLVFRPQTEGAEHVPAEGAAILASNHLSYADWLFMPLTLTRRVTFVAKAEYFTTPGIKGWFQKKFFSGAGQVPIDRTGASAAEGALAAAKRILDQGELFGIYPEGTRSHDGRLYRGKTGVARLALETKVPVIPIAVVGTDGEHVLVRSRRLVWDDDARRLSLGAAAEERVRYQVDGEGFVDRPQPGETLALHWDWTCDRLTDEQADQLQRWTGWQLDATNRRLAAGPGPARP